MKINRLLSIIVYLLNRDLVSARELAERYGVSVRTIRRDDDLFYIITSLSSIGSSLTNQKIASTAEKMKSLLRNRDEPLLAEKHEKLFVDFSMLGGTGHHAGVFHTIERAVDDNRLLQFEYTNNRLESTERIVEPMTIVFKWRSWYVFAYCRLKGDYRLFRLSRVRNPRILPVTLYTQEAKNGNTKYAGTAHAGHQNLNTG